MCTSCRSPPAALMSILSATEELLENILGGVQVGEFAVVQALSMEHCCILGYLLSWKLLFTFFKASSSHVSKLSVIMLWKAVSHCLILSDALLTETFLNGLSDVHFIVTEILSHNVTAFISPALSDPE